MRKTILTAGLVLGGAAGAVAASTPFHGSTSRYVQYSSQGEVPIAGIEGQRGYVRTGYVLPAKWRRDSSLHAQTLRFDTRNSCRHKVTFTPRLVVAGAAGAEARAALEVPGNGSYLLAQGTRDSAAFRVVRRTGTNTIDAVLVQPLPAGSSVGVPAGERLFAELHARATADPGLECHAGAPRSVAAAIGAAFGAGGVGGFALRPR